MDCNLPMKPFEAVFAVVNVGAGSKVLKIAKAHGVTGGTIFVGSGTIKSRILEVFDLTDVRKEIVCMVAEKTAALEAMEAINREMHLHKAHHGIVFSMAVSCVFGLPHLACGCVNQKKEEVDSVYKAIFVVVEKGRAEDVMDAATKAGARGGTIINARGSGIHETQKIFSINIEPEKEVVLILAANEIAEAVITSIRDGMRIDEPGNGIIFVQDVSNAYGLY